VAVNCSWLSAVIEMGMDCTSAPPSFDDVTVTVSTDVRGAGEACASCSGATSFFASSRIIATELAPWRWIEKPVPIRMLSNADAGENSPFAPLVRAPRTSSGEYISSTWVCLA